MNARDYQLIVLSSFINVRENFVRLGPELSEDCFTEADLFAVYSSMLQLGEKFTVPELAAKVEGSGGLALIRDIVDCYSRYGLDKRISFEDSCQYATTVDKLGRLHQLNTLLKDAINKLDKPSKKDQLASLDDEKFIADLVVSLTQQQNAGEHTGFRSYDYYLAEYKGRLGRLLKGDSSDDRLSTGFTSLDAALGGGLPERSLVVIGGLPGSGKTQLALQFVLNIARRLKESGVDGICAINSIDMTGVGLVSRAIMANAEIDSALLRTGGYRNDREAIDRLKAEFKSQVGLPIFIDESEFLTTNIISTRVSGLKARYKNVVLVVTDFAEIVADRGESPEQKVSAVFTNSRALAKRLGCPVIVLSQLSRQVEMTGSRVPSIRHLRYSGMAEAIADAIILIYNPNYYVDNGIKIMPHPDMPPRPGIAYPIIGKHKDGSTGFLAMGWVAQYTRWSDLGPKTKLKQYAAIDNDTHHYKQER